MALYFFDRKVIDKPTIHEYARWCMKQITDYNAVNMFQWKLTRGVQMQEQQRLFEKQNQFNHMSQLSSNAKTIHFQALSGKATITGCPVFTKCFVACIPLDESSHPT